MKKLRQVVPLLAAIIATWYITSASAQSSIPNGVFVRDGNDTIWLVLNGQRIPVPLWVASDAELGALPESTSWAVTNADGVIGPGERPSWFGTDFSPLVGRWERRDAWMFVSEEGLASVRWKLGICQSPASAQPCDRVENGVVIPGGRAELRLLGISGRVASGFVALSNTDLFLSGAVTVTQRAPDLVAIKQLGHPELLLCRPPRELNTCD